MQNDWEKMRNPEIDSFIDKDIKTLLKKRKRLNKDWLIWYFNFSSLTASGGIIFLFVDWRIGMVLMFASIHLLLILMHIRNRMAMINLMIYHKRNDTGGVF